MRFDRRVGVDQLHKTFLGVLARIEIIDHASVLAVEDAEHALTSRPRARRPALGRDAGRPGVRRVQERERGRVLAWVAW
jgi:hypothetical protein